MPKYAIKMPCLTKAKDSVDGKAHRRTLWFAGEMDLFFAIGPTWGAKHDRVIFNTKAEANKIAKRYAYDGVEVVKVEGRK